MMKDARFAKFVLFVNALVPLCLLSWDYFRRTLGANPTEYVLRTTGMLALVFLLLTLAVTPLRKIFGYNGLSHFRRMLGLFAFFYATIHLSYWFIVDRWMDFRGALEDVLERQYILIGLTTLLLMVPLVITSTNGMIKRMGAAKWKQLHRLTYVAAAGGMTHYYMIGKVLTPLHVTLIAVLLALLGFRAVFAIRDRMKRARLTRLAAV